MLSGYASAWFHYQTFLEQDRDVDPDHPAAA
jgi:hypothetical protein